MDKLSTWATNEKVKEFLETIPEGLDKDKVTPVMLSDQLAKNLRNLLLKEYKTTHKYYPAKVSNSSLAMVYNKNELLSIVDLFALKADIKHLEKRFANEVALLKVNTYTDLYAVFVDKLEFFQGPLIDYADELNKVWNDEGMCWGYRIKG